MPIKKQLLKSNIYMVIIPVILIMIASGILYLSFIRIYGSPKKALEDEVKNPQMIQRVVAEFSNHMQYSQNIGNMNEIAAELQNRLLDVGFYSAITRDNEVISSNFTEEVQAFANNNGIKNISMLKSFTIQSGSTFMIYDSFQKDQNRFTITAINPNYTVKSVDWKSRMTAVGSYVIIIFILSIIIIIVTDGVISAKTAKKIIAPLDLLNYGAEQIKNGNLDFKIAYNSKDEFGTAISNFDEMRQRLRESIQAQLKYEEDRKELVAGISHDLRTPLTAIKGYVKGLKDGVANTLEKQQRYHEIIYSKACEMDVLVDKLFLFSKLDTGHLPFYFEKVNCKEYLDNFVRNVTEDFERKGVKISYQNECPQNMAVKLDSDQMSRVFVNILENSAKYKPKDICHVDFIASKHGTDVVIELHDDGRGVPEEILPNLFKSFYRGDASRTNPHESSGLGLSIAERIVKAHNGTIEAKNKNGLAIIIKLPVFEEE